MADGMDNDGPYDPFAETMPPEEGQGQQSSNDAYADSRSRSRSPVRKSRSRSRSPRDWKRNERNERNRERSDRSRERDRDRDRRGGGSGQKRLYISNIPYELRWQDLKDLFREKVGEVTYVELYESADGKPCGSGIIEFKDRETAQKAIESMHKYDIKGRKIVVREERESDRRRHARNQNQPMGNQGGGGGGGGGGNMSDMGSLNMGSGMGGSMGGSMGSSSGSMGNIGKNRIHADMGSVGMGGGMNMNSMNNCGISPQILQQLGIDGPVTSQVFIANLDYKVTIKKIRDIFKMAGSIVNAELKVDKEGKSRGMAIVQFETQLEAVQGISMFNGQILYDRAMSVRMDKMAEQNAGPTPQRLPSGLKTIGMGLGMNGAPLSGMNQLQAMMNQGNMGSMGGGLGMGNMGGGNMGGGSGGMGGNMGNMGGSMGGMNNNSSSGVGMNMGGGGAGMGNMGGGGMGSGMGGMGSMGMGGNFGDGMMGGMGGNSMGMNSMGASNMGMGTGGMDSMGMRGGMDSMGGMGGMGGSGGSSSMGNMNMAGSMGNLGGMGLMGMGGSGSPAVGQSSLMRSSSNNRGIDLDNTTVFVRNLPFTYTWQNLKEKFRHIGDVKYAAIRMENNRSKGCGVVRFTSQDEARRAINMMHGARIEGREIEVRMDAR